MAVLVSPWHEPVDPPERGTRVEVRLLDQEPRRGSWSAAQRVVIDQPAFRADLFDLVDRPPGNLASAHFHPNFDGVEPSDRIWPDEIKQDPAGWLAGELADLGHLLDRAGVDSGDARGSHATRARCETRSPRSSPRSNATWETVRSAPV